MAQSSKARKEPRLLTRGASRLVLGPSARDRMEYSSRFRMAQCPPRLPLGRLPPSVLCSARVPVALSLHPNRLETCFDSLLFLSSAPAKCREGFPGQVIGRDDDYAVRLRIGNIDHPMLPSRCRPPPRSSPHLSPAPLF